MPAAPAAESRSRSPLYPPGGSRRHQPAPLRPASGRPVPKRPNGRQPRGRHEALALRPDAAPAAAVAATARSPLRGCRRHHRGKQPRTCRRWVPSGRRRATQGLQGRGDRDPGLGRPVAHLGECLAAGTRGAPGRKETQVLLSAPAPHFPRLGPFSPHLSWGSVFLSVPLEDALQSPQALSQDVPARTCPPEPEL